MLDAGAGSLPITLEMRDSRDAVFRERVDAMPWVRLQSIRPEESYILRVEGPSGSAASITVYSPLLPLIQREE